MIRSVAFGGIAAWVKFVFHCVNFFPRKRLPRENKFFKSMRYDKVIVVLNVQAMMICCFDLANGKIQSGRKGDQDESLFKRGSWIGN
jgi:hypothetical protein